MRDLKVIGMENWHAICQDRERWSSLCAVAVDEVAQCREENTCTANRASQERNFSVFVEDVSDDREILPDFVVFVMCEACH